MKSNEQLIVSMIEKGILHSPQIINAFKKIDRKYFVPKEFQTNIYEDRPLPIGNNQTISQPSTVAFMLELLSPQKGDNILDIGSGSGWTTTLLCDIVGDDGTVDGIERVDMLVELGRANIAKFFKGQKRCTIQKATKELGKPNKEFDKILVSASAKELPKELFNQLKEGGILVIPIQNSIYKFQKITQKDIKAQEYPGFVFVPLIDENH